ncbi:MULTISPECIES: hypothetical protein [unclassified Kribbella]|uniref:hypothetical protein n=1 Tax=unclassified Kribbella TaxID=2644121 RepID=UPI00301AAC06
MATERFVAMLRGEGHPAVVASASDASSADLICLCMSAVLAGLSAGTHVNAVGRLVVATLAARNAGLID